MFVVNTAIPEPHSKIYLPTRVIVSEREQADAISTALDIVGYFVDVEETEGTPVISDDERTRAMHLMTLLFAPVVGSRQ